MNVNKVLTKDYVNKTLGEHGKNEPKTNPIKANFRKAKMNVNNVNKVLTKDYENTSNWALGQNKANTNPIKPNLSRRSLWRSRIKPNFRGKKMLLRLTINARRAFDRFLQVFAPVPFCVFACNFDL